ncbi:CBS domain-containing protein [Pseudonocardia ammonioxydans]|uniref:CBS domain-containing protein n=1 Tax=Pseudonocardia ammonioxydans TaxID=260086 RepID=A0A1I4YKS0_PSUAM|nr:CBS domain-containing protein [Pseudonocardia ammonioxydans]SFN38587.1 CBS domain-containing protein [Pseudonocardia ammonioxydans]
MPREQPTHLSAPPETLDSPHDPPLRTIMSPRLVAVTPQTPVRVTLALMVAHDVHHLPVFRGGRCVGLVTEADLLRGMAAQRSPLGTIELPVAEVHGDAVVLPGTALLSEAAAVMDVRGRDAVLVTESGRVRGIVTAMDVVRHVGGVRRRDGNGR